MLTQSQFERVMKELAAKGLYLYHKDHDGNGDNVWKVTPEYREGAGHGRPHTDGFPTIFEAAEAAYKEVLARIEAQAHDAEHSHKTNAAEAERMRSVLA